MGFSVRLQTVFLVLYGGPTDPKSVGEICVSRRGYIFIARIKTEATRWTSHLLMQLQFFLR